MRPAGITGHVVVITDPRIKPPTLDLLLTNDGLLKDHLVLSLNPGLLGVRGVILAQGDIRTSCPIWGIEIEIWRIESQNDIFVFFA